MRTAAPKTAWRWCLRLCWAREHWSRQLIGAQPARERQWRSPHRPASYEGDPRLAGGYRPRSRDECDRRSRRLPRGAAPAVPVSRERLLHRVQVFAADQHSRRSAVLVMTIRSCCCCTRPMMSETLLRTVRTDSVDVTRSCHTTPRLRCLLAGCRRRYCERFKICSRRIVRWRPWHSMQPLTTPSQVRWKKCWIEATGDEKGMG